MSPEETQETVELIERVQEEMGLTILLVEHDMEIVFSISDRIAVLHQGEIIARGRPMKYRATRTSRRRTSEVSNCEPARTRRRRQLLRRESHPLRDVSMHVEKGRYARCWAVTARARPRRSERRGRARRQFRTGRSPTRTEHHGPADRGHLGAGHLARPRGAARVRQPHRRGKPPPRRGRLEPSNTWGRDIDFEHTGMTTEEV